jgi:hypothetical protein
LSPPPAPEILEDDEPATVCAYLEGTLPAKSPRTEKKAKIDPTEFDVPAVDGYADTSFLPAPNEVQKLPGFVTTIRPLHREKRKGVTLTKTPKKSAEVSPHRSISTEVRGKRAIARPTKNRPRPRPVERARKKRWLATDQASLIVCLMLGAIVTYAFFMQLV